MNPRSTRLFPILGAIFITGCSLKGMLTPMHLDDYRGDGTISRIKFLPNPGVRVEFGAFTVSKPFRATYRLDGLPHRPFPYSARLVVPYPDDYHLTEHHKLFRVSGTLELALLTEDGATVFRCQGIPWWQGVFGGTFSNAEAGFSKCEGVRGDEPYILPDDLKSESHTRLLLDVTWSPGDDAPDLKGWIELKSGGST